MNIIENLSERESQVLTATVKDYIDTAQPVASGRVRELYRLRVSPATIRHTMALLEQMGYLTHPHTSAGKVPTDKGYRTYVNELMVVESIGNEIAPMIRTNLDMISGDVDRLLQIVAHIISQLSGGIGITIAPINLHCPLRAIRLVPVSDQRMLFVLELEVGNVRTVVVETKLTVKESLLTTVEEILNERLSGLTLEEVQATLDLRLEGTLAEDLGITALILEHSNEFFEESDRGEMHIFGLNQILQSPEFSNHDNVVSLVKLVEDQLRLRELFSTVDSGPDVKVTIGEEHRDKGLATFATISRSFSHYDSTGTLAVLAPKRVNYPQVFAVLEYMSNTLPEII
jgi:heat-inducible transcriptional repressor